MKGYQMNKEPKFRSIRFAAIAAAGLFASAISGHSQGAVATFSDVPVTGGFDYTILLQNTGTTVLNSFWYGWTTGGNNLPSIPSGPTNSLGWGNSVVGNSIEWVNSTGTTLAPGNSGTFFFFSTSTPAQMTANGVGASVAYVNGIDFSENSPGHSTPVFTPSAVPEPSATALFIGSLGLLAGWGRLRIRKLSLRRAV